MQPLLNIIGAGRAGTAIAGVLRRYDLVEIGGIVNSAIDSARKAAAVLGAGEPLADAAALQPAPLWMIAVPDSDIAAIAGTLAEHPSLRAGDIVFHCSGALPAAVLAPLSARGAFIAAAHPAAMFPPGESLPDGFTGMLWTLEGDKEACARIGGLVGAAGAITRRISSEQKLPYHAACVLASNDLVALLHAAQRTFALAGIDANAADLALNKLSRHALDSTLALGPRAALTGPVARGDWHVIEAEAAALHSADPALAALFLHLAREAQRIAGHEEQQ